MSTWLARTALGLLELVGVLLVEAADVGRLHGDLAARLPARASSRRAPACASLRGAGRASSSATSSACLNAASVGNCSRTCFIASSISASVAVTLTPRDLLLQQPQRDQIVEHAAVHLDRAARRARGRPARCSTFWIVVSNSARLISSPFTFAITGGSRQAPALAAARAAGPSRPALPPAGSCCGGAGLRGRWLRGLGSLRGGAASGTPRWPPGATARQTYGLLHRNLGRRHAAPPLGRGRCAVGCAVANAFRVSGRYVRARSLLLGSSPGSMLVAKSSSTRASPDSSPYSSVL